MAAPATSSHITKHTPLIGENLNSSFWDSKEGKITTIVGLLFASLIVPIAPLTLYFAYQIWTGLDRDEGSGISTTFTADFYSEEGTEQTIKEKKTFIVSVQAPEESSCSIQPSLENSQNNVIVARSAPIEPNSKERETLLSQKRAVEALHSVLSTQLFDHLVFKRAYFEKVAYWNLTGWSLPEAEQPALIKNVRQFPGSDDLEGWEDMLENDREFLSVVKDQAATELEKINTQLENMR